MKFSLALPLDQIDPAEEFCTAEAISEMARAAEAAGFHAVHVTDHPFPDYTGPEMGGHFALDLTVALTVAASATRTIKLHTNGLVLPYRNPFLAAKLLCDLDVVSGGRVIAGVVSGYMAGEFAALGAKLDDRNALMDEGIRAMIEAWSGDPVYLDSTRWNAAGNRMLPRCVQRPHPPVWVGGNSNMAIRRAALLADGWMPFPARPSEGRAVRTASLSSREELRSRIEMCFEHREMAGKAGIFDICMTPFTHPHHPRGAENYEPAVLLDEIGELAEAGVTWVSVKARSPNRAEFINNIHLWREDVLKHLI